MIDQTLPAAGLWGLGLTQVVGFGTLYYSFSILAPSMAADFAWSEQWLFGILSASLLASGLLAPTAGRLADRLGAGRVMSFGSLAAAAALAITALAPERVTFIVGLVMMELAAAFVLYSTAFVLVVQTVGSGAQRRLTQLTLIGGFASTLFWPLTSTLHEHTSWREVHLVFAGLHLAVCLPIHRWLARLPRLDRDIAPSAAPRAQAVSGTAGERRRRSRLFLLMLAGFAVEGFVLSSVLVHMVPLTAALGLGSARLVVTTLFGPAQVASRLINMLFGERLPQALLATIAAALLPLALLALLTTTPWIPGAVAFVILFGLGSGLISIVGGTLPLELFGREGYGAQVGWASAARQFSSALAPFAFALAMAGMGVGLALWTTAAIGTLGIAVFLAIASDKRAPGQTTT